MQSYRGGAVPVTIDAALRQRLERFCQTHNVTLFMGLLSARSVLMARLGNERDVVIGVPSANRGRTETENLIGFFVNTTALRVDLAQNPSVAQLLEQVCQTTLAAHEHQDIPFEQVIEALQPPRSMSHSPLCQVALSLDNTSIGSELQLPGLSLHPVLQAHETAQFDLMLTTGSETALSPGSSSTPATSSTAPPSSVLPSISIPCSKRCSRMSRNLCSACRCSARRSVWRRQHCCSPRRYSHRG